jgi:hypothetical protein
MLLMQLPRCRCVLASTNAANARAEFTVLSSPLVSMCLGGGANNIFEPQRGHSVQPAWRPLLRRSSSSLRLPAAPVAALRSCNQTEL